MIISLNTREKIIALLDRLVAENKIKKNIDGNGMVSFSPFQNVPLEKEIIVTREGGSVLLDDVLNADEDDVIVDLMRFMGANDAAIPGNKIARDSNNQVYNEVLANMLLSIRYNKLKSNGILKMTLPTAHDWDTYNNEEILIARGFTANDITESVSGYKNNMKINSAVQDLINFYREQMQTLTMQREERTQNLGTSSPIDALLAAELRNEIERADQEFKNSVDKRLKSLLNDCQALHNERLALDKKFNELPKSYLRKARKGKAKTPEEASQKREAARATKASTGAFCEVAGELSGFLIPLPFLMIGGIVYGFNERSYQSAKRKHLRALTYFGYDADKQSIQDRLTKVYQEAANYLALLNPEDAAQYMTLLDIQEISSITTSTQSYATTSSALYSSSNPANPANLAQQLEDAAEDELKIPTKSSP